jgi:hypothetical protein
MPILYTARKPGKTKPHCGNMKRAEAVQNGSA